MSPEDAVMRVSLVLLALAAVGLWQLRDGTRLSNWLDREIADSGHLPKPVKTRIDVKA